MASIRVDNGSKLGVRLMRGWCEKSLPTDILNAWVWFHFLESEKAKNSWFQQRNLVAMNIFTGH